MIWSLVTLVRWLREPERTDDDETMIRWVIGVGFIALALALAVWAVADADVSRWGATIGAYDAVGVPVSNPMPYSDAFGSYYEAESYRGSAAIVASFVWALWEFFGVVLYVLVLGVPAWATKVNKARRVRWAGIKGRLHGMRDRWREDA